MRRSRLLVLGLVLAALLPLAGCTKGEECDTCSSDADCKNGLLCVNFLDDNGNVVSQRCGSGVGATTCRVR
jgi:hypothetical protein